MEDENSPGDDSETEDWSYDTLTRNQKYQYNKAKKEGKEYAPRSSKPAGERAPVKKRTQRTTAQPLSKARVAKSLNSYLTWANIGVGWMVPPLREDILTTEEVFALSDALAEEAIVHERLAQIITTAVANERHVKLISVLVMIALPRLARRGLVPLDLAETLAFAFAQNTQPGATSNTVPVEPFRAPVDSGGHGVGEEHTSGGDTEEPAVSYYTEVQAGHSEVRSNGQSRSRRHARPSQTDGEDTLVASSSEASL